jgi:hypothetical protein
MVLCLSMKSRGHTVITQKLNILHKSCVPAKCSIKVQFVVLEHVICLYFFEHFFVILLVLVNCIDMFAYGDFEIAIRDKEVNGRNG